jgi:DNA-binding NtrC family response regulator
MNKKPDILIVDDEEIVRRSYARILSGAQCNADTVWNGDEALRAMERQPYDVVLLDLRMPGTDGMAVLKTIKQKWPESEVVVITGYPSIETAKESVRLGAYDYLAKPVGPEEVIGAAQGAVTRKQWALHPVRAGRGACNDAADPREAQDRSYVFGRSFNVPRSMS